MAEEQDCRKGQNLEMIVSKLTKEKPSNGLGNLILISGVNIQNLSCPADDDEDDEEPDLHQCGKCKRMFMNLERYLRHRTGKQCRKRQPESVENHDGASSPNNMPEIVQMEATVPVNNFREYGTTTDQQDLANKRKHERKGVARKRTHGMVSERADVLPSGEQTKRVTIDRLQEIIHPEYTNNTQYLGMAASQANYSSEPVAPNNNDLYALMELTKNSGIKEVKDQNDQGQHHELLNGEVITNFYSLPTMQHVPQIRGTGPQLLVSHKPLAAMNPSAPTLLPYPTAVIDPGVVSTKALKRRYKCEKCNREFNQRANLRRHQLVHSGEKPFECPQCQRRFQQQGDLKRHMLRHAEGTSYPCHVCDKKFMRIDRFKAHLKSHVENGELAESELGFTEEQNGILEGTDAEDSSAERLVSHHTCSKCNQTFMEPDELLVHTCAEMGLGVVTTAPQKPEEPDAATASMAEGIRRSMAADADHSRTYSSSRSASKGKLTNPHKCPLCNAYYKNVDSLKTHILKHSGEKKYKCDQCPKAFFTSSNLKIHKRIHSGDKPLKCKICLKAFSDPSNFNKHKKSHTKIKSEVRGPGKRGKASKGAMIREIKEEQGDSTALSNMKAEEPVMGSVPAGQAMEFGSQTRDFVQSQYEALLPALGESTAPDTEQEKAPEEPEPLVNEDGDFAVPYVQSPSF